MAYPPPAAPTVLRAPPAVPEPGPVGVPQDRNTGMVSRATAVSAGLRSTVLAVATAYGSGLRFVLMPLPLPVPVLAIAAGSGAGVPGLSVVAVSGLVCPAGAR